MATKDPTLTPQSPSARDTYRSLLSPKGTNPTPRSQNPTLSPLHQLHDRSGTILGRWVGEKLKSGRACNVCRRACANRMVTWLSPARVGR
eukprot:6209181-Pleurochrysis_carterae.AAC.3